MIVPNTLFTVARGEPRLHEEAFEFFESNGFVVLQGMLREDELRELRRIVYDLASEEFREKRGHNYGHNMQRVWNLLDKHDTFHDLILSPQLLAWMDRIFDRPTPHQKYFLSSFQANILKPGAQPLQLHIDTPVPEPLPPWVLKANSIWVLDPFTECNGATEVIPGSHRRTRKPNRSDPEDHHGIVKVIAPAGAVILTHGALWHRSGANTSDGTRAVLLGSFAASFAREIASEEDIVRCVSAATMDRFSVELKTLVGYFHGLKPGGGFEPRASASNAKSRMGE